MVAFLEADAEARVGEGGKVICNVDMFVGHVDEQVGHGELAHLLLFLGGEHLHEAEVLGGHLAVLVAEKDVVGGLLADDDEPGAGDAEHRPYAILDVLDLLLVEVFYDENHGGKSLEVR